MLKSFLLITFILSLGNLAFAGSVKPVNEYDCSKVDSKISSINSQMRAGYSAQQGERLRDQLRALKKQRDKCKKKKYRTSE